MFLLFMVLEWPEMFVFGITDLWCFRKENNLSSIVLGIISKITTLHCVRKYSYCNGSPLYIVYTFICKHNKSPFLSFMWNLKLLKMNFYNIPMSIHALKIPVNLKMNLWSKLLSFSFDVLWFSLVIGEHVINLL